MLLSLLGGCYGYRECLTLSSFLDLLGTKRVIMVKSVPTWLRALKNLVVSVEGRVIWSQIKA